MTIDDLFKEAEKFYPKQYYYTDIGEADYNALPRNAFAVGAQWREEQVINKVKDFIIEWFYEHPRTHMVCSDEFGNVDELLERLKKSIEGGEE